MDSSLYRSLESLLKEHLSEDRIQSICGALQRSPQVSTLRINTLQIDNESIQSLIQIDNESIESLLDNDISIESMDFLSKEIGDNFIMKRSKDIPELVTIEQEDSCINITPVGLEVQVSLAAAKAFLRGSDIYAVHKRENVLN